MQEMKRRTRIIIAYTLSIILIGGYPVSLFAQTVPEAETTIVAPTETTAPEPTYTYDPATNRWNTTTWRYNSATDQYEPVVVMSEPVAEPVVVETEPSDTTDSLRAATAGSPTSIDDESSVTSVIDSTAKTSTATTNTIENNQTATAQTGDAAVLSNTQAGNATTGDAAADTTVVNVVNSTVGGGSTAYFTSDISGDVYGDIILNPIILGALLLQSAGNPTTAYASSVTLNSDTNNQLTNNIDLSAVSGDATVAGNTGAGSALTGTANTVANVMNIINSIIAANQSFVGTINIYGNLNGDILIAPDFIAQLIASNGGTSTTNQAVATSIDVNLSDVQAITNNIDLSATSGDATVTGNTAAGSALTGTATTNITILNLTGRQVIASNSMLVFVNVLGKWIGLIVDAPVGATSAAIGSGLDQNMVMSAATNASLDADVNNRITNNISLDSRSGDAMVSRNTQAGDATSGNATASANILNMSQSSFGLTGWFGILFINVFGSWLGSFGIDTPNGNARPVVNTQAGTGKTPATPQPIQAIQFSPRTPWSSYAPVQAVAPATITTEAAATATDLDYIPTVLDIDLPRPVLASIDSLSPTVNILALYTGLSMAAYAIGRGLWLMITKA
jgi:hypothetical protein